MRAGLCVTEKALTQIRKARKAPDERRLKTLIGLHKQVHVWHPRIKSMKFKK